MTTLQLNFHDYSFKKYVGYSLAAHVVVVLIFTVKAIFFGSDHLQYEAAVKVDLVALPDKIDAQEKKAFETAPEPVATPPPTMVEKEIKKEVDKDAINLDKVKKKQNAAIDKLKQLSALEAIENKVKEENTKEALEKLKQIKGNALSAGSELKGVTKLQHDNYIASVERHIRQNWSLPEWLSKKNLKAQVRVRFDENGNIVAKEIYQSSGNPSFDEIVMATIQNSSPVPAPPPKFVRILSLEGILLGFPE